MNRYVENVKQTAESFSIFDIGVLKICLFALGILSGVYFYRFFSTKTKWVWTVYISSFVYVMYRAARNLCYCRR
ncbi:MAG: hypothetical protein EA344_05895 [Alkalicoccus sp.]|nr:MAG: hypothetical protein EA344_05895 [Alkalicoccus sp.]